MKYFVKLLLLLVFIFQIQIPSVSAEILKGFGYTLISSTPADTIDETNLKIDLSYDDLLRKKIKSFKSIDGESTVTIAILNLSPQENYYNNILSYIEQNTEIKLRAPDQSTKSFNSEFKYLIEQKEYSEILSGIVIDKIDTKIYASEAGIKIVSPTLSFLYEQSYISLGSVIVELYSQTQFYYGNSLESTQYELKLLIRSVVDMLFKNNIDLTRHSTHHRKVISSIINSDIEKLKNSNGYEDEKIKKSINEKILLIQKFRKKDEENLTQFKFLKILSLVYIVILILIFFKCICSYEIVKKYKEETICIIREFTNNYIVFFRFILTFILSKSNKIYLSIKNNKFIDGKEDKKIPLGLKLVALHYFSSAFVDLILTVNFNSLHICISVFSLILAYLLLKLKNYARIIMASLYVVGIIITSISVFQFPQYVRGEIFQSINITLYLACFIYLMSSKTKELFSKSI